MSKRSQSGGLLAEVRKEMSSYRHGPLPWYERVPEEHREELDAILAAWRAGELGTRKKTLARSIANQLRARGISDVGEQGVIAWLSAG